MPQVLRGMPQKCKIALKVKLGTAATAYYCGSGHDVCKCFLDTYIYSYRERDMYTYTNIDIYRAIYDICNKV